jgi:uncharacterized protein
MRKWVVSLGAWWILAALGLAQTVASITASGSASASANPDQATITVSVSTTAVTAIDASNMNATQTNAVIQAVQATLGSTGEIRTISYSLQPNYNNNSNNIVNYTATNSVQIVTSDLSLTGKLIDVAVQAGATRVQTLSFGLKDSQPLRSQALKAAAMVARTQVQAIASGLGVTLGRIIAATDGSVSVSPINLSPGGASTVTPIVTGPVQVNATVQLSMQIVQ